jgi:hypothetical protein
MQGLVDRPMRMKPAFTRGNRPGFRVLTVTMPVSPRGYRAIIFIFWSRDNPIKYTDPDGKDLKSWLYFFGRSSKGENTSTILNDMFPSSNPGMVAEFYSKADQSGNPFTFEESLKQGFLQFILIRQFSTVRVKETNTI